MTVNILTPAQYCRRFCGLQFGKDAGALGDVRRCEHGRYWMWRYWHLSFDGRWVRLSVLRDPIKIRRARRAFAEAKPEVQP